MGFSGQLLTVTNKGLQVDLKWHAGAQPHFTRFGFGEGSLAGAAPELLTDMIAPVCYKAMSSIVVTTGQAVAMVTLDKADIPREFVWREIALFAHDPDSGNEIMYAYGNAGSAGQVLSPVSMDAQVMRVPIKISRTDNITFDGGSGVYVTAEEMAEALAGKASAAELEQTKQDVTQQLQAQNTAITQQLAAQDQAVDNALANLQPKLVTADYVLLGGDAWTAITHPDGAWQQEIDVPGMGVEQRCAVTYAPGHRTAYEEAGVAAIDNDVAGKVLFVCREKPTVNITVRIEPR
ncbi:hypothetical protein ACH6CV_14410 [Bacillota bacterium Meth-B3]